jgi:selenocysteine lyase/cysteine desulfurase
MTSAWGICVRFGCHCANLIIKQLSDFTPLQEKIQKFVVELFPILKLQRIVRVSFGIQNTEADVDALIAELKRIT